MKQIMYYVKDADRYYCPSADPRSPLLTTDNAAKKLARLDSKFEDKAGAYAYLKELKDFGISGAELDELRNTAKKAKETDFTTIYEEFRQMLPLYSYIRPNGNRSLFLVSEARECTPIEYVDLDSLLDALMGQKATWAAVRNFWATTPHLEGQRNKYTLSAFLKFIIPNFLLVDERFLLDCEPKRFSWEPDDFAFKKFDMGSVASGPTPTWDQFLARLDYPDVFQAWVWSLFEPTNNVRQVMWLQGGGNDGKSSVQKALERMFGEQHVYAMKTGDEHEKWFANSVYGKCLVNYADCSNIYLLRTNSIKQLTGGDTTSIEGKGVNAFRGKIYAKLLVTSNQKPMINPESEAETSRLIVITVKPLAESDKDAGFEERLVAEQSAFLHACQEKFATHVAKGNNKLELPVGLADKMLSECASEMYYVMQDFVDKHLEFGKNYFCESRKLGPKIKEFTSQEHWLPADKVKYFVSDFSAKMNFSNIQLQRLDVKGKMVTAYVGFRLKGESDCNLKLLVEGAG